MKAIASQSPRIAWLRDCIVPSGCGCSALGFRHRSMDDQVRLLPLAPERHPPRITPSTRDIIRASRPKPPGAKGAYMDPITPHLNRAERKTRRASLDQQIAGSPMRVPAAMRSVSRELFADGAISKKHKELTALTVAVATNCWE